MQTQFNVLTAAMAELYVEERLKPIRMIPKRNEYFGFVMIAKLAYFSFYERELVH